MIDLRGATVVVAGGGIMGSATALALARLDARVVLVDHARLGDNASGIAAGMLAPAMETLVDGGGWDSFQYLRAARDAWTSFADGLPLDRDGALWVAGPDGAGTQFKRLRDAGAGAEIVDAGQAMRLSPGLHAPHGAVYTPEDWRLDPAVMLAAIQARFRSLGGQVIGRKVTGWTQGCATLDDADRLPADWLVLAGGYTGPSALAPEMAALTPIKGQILRFVGAAPRGGPTVRSASIYVAPGLPGPAAGATMEEGLSDRRIDPAAFERLRTAAAALFPDLALAPADHFAAVRAAAADGLPVVGRSEAEGVVLATGARRNGWLLAPLAAQIVAGVIAGAPPPPEAAAMDPGRLRTQA